MSIEFLRGVVGLIGVACAWMAACNVVALRRSKQPSRRVYGWFARTALCLVAAGVRHPVDRLDIVLWCLSVAAFADGWRRSSRAKPAEDLTHTIFPGEQ